MIYFTFCLIFIFILGLAFGSFFNSVISRLKEGKTILGKSKCPHGEKNLRILDLIPILSFFLLKNRCRYCKKKISWRYPLVEFMTGIIFVAVFLKASLLGSRSFDFYFIFDLVSLLFFSSILILIFVYDFKYSIISDKILYPAIFLGFVFLILRLFGLTCNQFLISQTLFQARNHLFAIFLAFGFFLVLYLLSHGRWIGGGDVKFGILLGLIIPWPNILVTLFLAFVLGAGVSIILVLLKKKKFKDTIPFGTFLVSATFLTLFFGEAILNWYLGLIL